MEAATKKGQRTKQRICDAALELIHKKGYPNVTIADICQAAGVSNGSFFHYFKTKDDVLVAFVENESAELIDYCESLDRRGVANAIDRLRLVMQWQASYYALKGEEFIAHLYSHIIRNKQQAKLDYSMVSVLRECFAKGQQQGLFNGRLTPQQMAEALFNSVLSVTAFTEWGQGIEQRLCGITEEFIKAFAPCD